MKGTIAILVVAAAACGGTKRSPQQYKTDSESVLASRNAQIQACYEKLLATDANAKGTVTVSFVVEKKTGVFKNAQIDPAKSEASEPVISCVLTAIQGLTLQPPDKNEGRGTFVYQLQPGA